jgi:hypothetical protein
MNVLASDSGILQSDKVHALRAGCVEAFPPRVKIELGPAAAEVGVSETLVEVEAGARADDLMFVVSARDCQRYVRLTSASNRVGEYSVII